MSEHNRDQNREQDPLGALLADNMGAYAPDRDAFRAGVERRIAAAAKRPGPLSDYLRQAAAFLPPMLMPKGLAKASAAAGSAAAKKFSWTIIPAAAALPLIAVIMLVMTIVMGLRLGAGSSSTQYSSKRHAFREVIGWWRRNGILALVLCAAVIWLGGHSMLDAITFSLMLSTLALMGILGSLAKAGLATRQEVGQRALSFLFILWPFLFQLPNLDVWVSVSSTYMLGPLVAGAGLLCGALSKERGGRPLRKQLLWAAAGSVGIVAIVAILTHFIGEESSDRGQAVAWLEDSEVALERHFGEYGRAVLMLERDGVGRPSTDSLAARFYAYSDAERAAQKELNTTSMIDLEALGFFREEDYAGARSEYRQGRMFLGQGYFDARSDGACFYAMQQVVPASEGELDLLVARIRASVENEEREDSLEDLELLGRLLERVGRPEELAWLRPAVLTALQSLWSGYEGAQEACFAGYTDSVERDEAGVPVKDHLTFVWLGSTGTALLAMDRFDLTEEFDSLALWSYLDRMGLAHRGSFDAYNLEAVAGRSLVESWPAYQTALTERGALGFLDVLWTMRLHLAAALASVLCVILTLRAPWGESEGVR